MLEWILSTIQKSVRRRRETILIQLGITKNHNMHDDRYHSGSVFWVTHVLVVQADSTLLHCSRQTMDGRCDEWPLTMKEKESPGDFPLVCSCRCWTARITSSLHGKNTLYEQYSAPIGPLGRIGNHSQAMGRTGLRGRWKDLHQSKRVTVGDSIGYSFVHSSESFQNICDMP